MPPAVAHAPIVTRNFDERRTWWMRSASCGVVMEPSTSDRSYGPRTTAREASAKLAISTALVSASSSSSQSSRLNWQPSQEANFRTASLGLWAVSMLELSYREKVLYAAVAKNWALLADESGTKLTVSAKTNGALHIAFH